MVPDRKVQKASTAAWDGELAVKLRTLSLQRLEEKIDDLGREFDLGKKEAQISRIDTTELEE